MEQRPGSIFDAITPDFNTPVLTNRGSHDVQKHIAVRMTKVLVLGGSTLDCNCLPVFDRESSESYVPIGEKGYVNPFLMFRVPHRDFYQPHFSLSKNEYRELTNYLHPLYALGIGQGCQKFFWAETPNSDSSNPEQCALKRRPVITMKQGLHFPTSTNHGRYSAPGPAIRLGCKPSRVSFVPIFLPKDCFLNSIGEALPPSDKNRIREHLLYNLPKVFTNPY